MREIGDPSHRSSGRSIQTLRREGGGSSIISKHPSRGRPKKLSTSHVYLLSSPPFFSFLFLRAPPREENYTVATRLIDFRVYFVLVYSILSHLFVCLRLPARMPDVMIRSGGFEPLSQLRTEYPHP